MCPTLYYETFKTQHEELIRQAEHERLIKQALAGQPNKWDQFQLGLGKFLISFGSRLRGLSPTQTPALNGTSKG